MNDPYKPLVFLVAGVTLGSLCLWFLIGEFLGSTHDVAANMANRTARSMSGAASVPLSPDRQLEADLKAQGISAQTGVSEQTGDSAGASVDTSAAALSHAPAGAPKRDASDSLVEPAGVQSGAEPSSAERADSDGDIVTWKSIDTLQGELVDLDGLPVAEWSSVASGDAVAQIADLSLNLVRETVKPGPELAAEISLDRAAHCRKRRGDVDRVGVLFRPGSAAIKGASLSELERIVSAVRRCQPSIVIVEPLLSSPVDRDDGLADRRANEIKYYLLQRGVSKNHMRFQDRS